MALSERGSEVGVRERHAVLDIRREVVGPGGRDDVDLERHPGAQLDRRPARNRRVDPFVEPDLMPGIEEDPEERVTEMALDDLEERAAGLARSEERRVGKEWRARGAPGD